jgi:hypothetical protein
LQKKYQQKLLEHQERATAFNQKLKKPTLNERAHLLTKLQVQQNKLQYKTNRTSETNLDNLIIPHHLMGKMTLREIIMWSAYHTEHHAKTLQKLYELKTISKKSHIFFFSLIPVFIFKGFIRKSGVIDVTIYNTFFALKTNY